MSILSDVYLKLHTSINFSSSSSLISTYCTRTRRLTFWQTQHQLLCTLCRLTSSITVVRVHTSTYGCRKIFTFLKKEYAMCTFMELLRKFSCANFNKSVINSICLINSHVVWTMSSLITMLCALS